MQKPAELCQHHLPTGRTCRQITLKNESLCRHHRRLFRHSEAETSQEQAMERLAAELFALDLPNLLQALYGKLTAIRTTLRTHPEAQLALAVTFQRPPGIRSDGLGTPNPTPIDFPENPAESMNYSNTIS